MSFSCLIAVARTCSTMLNASGKSWHSRPVEKVGTFHHWVWCWLWVSHIRMACIGFPCGSAGKEAARNAGDLGSIPGLGRSPAEGNGNPLQCSYLENPMDRGAWLATFHSVTKSWTRLKRLNMHPRTYLVLTMHCSEFLTNTDSLNLHSNAKR